MQQKYLIIAHKQIELDKLKCKNELKRLDGRKMEVTI